MKQLTIQHQIARTAAQEGMDRALQGAENKVPTWGEIAYRYIIEYAKKNERFAGWMIVKAAALDPNFPKPDNERAWGGPIKKAARAGAIARDGEAKDPYRHGNPIPVWRSTIYGNAV